MKVDDIQVCNRGIERKSILGASQKRQRLKFDETESAVS
jgi:hypothetical protein